MKNSSTNNQKISQYLFWLWQHKLLMTVAIGSLAYVISYWLFRPQINPNPSQHFVISGHFPYSKGLTLALQVSFNSRNPSCKQIARAFFIFPAAEVNRSIELDVAVKRTAENHYEAELNADHFMPGFCEWEYGGMSYQILGDKQSDTNQHALGPVPHKANRSTLVCEYSSIPKTNRLHVYCRKATPPYFDIDKRQPSVELNFLWKED